MITALSHFGSDTYADIGFVGSLSGRARCAAGCQREAPSPPFLQPHTTASQCCVHVHQRPGSVAGTVPAMCTHVHQRPWSVADTVSAMCTLSGINSINVVSACAPETLVHGGHCSGQMRAVWDQQHQRGECMCTSDSRPWRTVFLPAYC